MYNLEILEKGCEELGITLNDTQKNQFIQFYEYLVEKNKVMNLTGITEFDEVLVKHFLDSLCCVKAVDMSKVKTVMDIGTGAGFPGVPLKIAFPEVEACLLDSLNKRVKFLEETFALLGLDGISAIHGRAEEYAKNKAYREKYDLCVSRAVSGLATLSEYCLPYVKVGGLFVSYKSGSVKEEAERAGAYYVNARWLGGMLTNFATIRRRIARLKQLRAMQEDGTFDLLPKKEVIKLNLEIEKLEKFMGGIKDMTEMPGALFIVDPRKERIAVSEAKKLNIPIVAIVDTNCDPDEIDYVIPGNDDAIRAVKLIAGAMANAVIEGREGRMGAAAVEEETAE